MYAIKNKFICVELCDEYNEDIEEIELEVELEVQYDRGDYYQPPFFEVALLNVLTKTVEINGEEFDIDSEEFDKRFFVVSYNSKTKRVDQMKFWNYIQSIDFTDYFDDILEG